MDITELTRLETRPGHNTNHVAGNRNWGDGGRGVSSCREPQMTLREREPAAMMRGMARELFLPTLTSEEM